MASSLPLRSVKPGCVVVGVGVGIVVVGSDGVAIN